MFMGQDSGIQIILSVELRTHEYHLSNIFGKSLNTKLFLAIATDGFLKHFLKRIISTPELINTSIYVIHEPFPISPLPPHVYSCKENKTVCFS